MKLYHLNGDDAGNLIADEDTHLVFCLDSIKKVDGYFAGRDIYLDEACSVLLHAVNGGTLGDKQPEVLKIFTRALQVCNRIFLMDGNLSDIYVDFVAKLAKDKRVIKIENQRKIPPHDITFIAGIDPEGEVKRRDKSSLVQHLISAEVKPFIATDSKEFSKVLDRLLTDLGQVGFCLNSETAGEDWAKQFMEYPDSFIEYRQPDYMIVSPTAESGVSITAKHFVEQAFNLEEFMTPESLECTAESLEFLATIDYTDGVEVLKDIRACTPIQALKAAANLLPEPLRKRIAEMVRSMNTPIETKPTSKEKPDIVTPHLPQVTKTDKPPTPPLSKEEEAFAEWSQLHKLIEVANEFLAPLAKLLPDQAIEKIKHILTFVPSKAVGLAAELLIGSSRDNLKPLLLTFDIAID